MPLTWLPVKLSPMLALSSGSGRSGVGRMRELITSDTRVVRDIRVIWIGVVKLSFGDAAGWIAARKVNDGNCYSGGFLGPWHATDGVINDVSSRRNEMLKTCGTRIALADRVRSDQTNSAVGAEKRICATEEMGAEVGVLVALMKQFKPTRVIVAVLGRNAFSAPGIVGFQRARPCARPH